MVQFRLESCAFSPILSFTINQIRRYKDTKALDKVIVSKLYNLAEIPWKLPNKIKHLVKGIREKKHKPIIPVF